MKLTLLFLFISTAALADSFFVKAPKVVGGKDNTRIVLKELVIQALEERGHEVTSVKKADSYVVDTTLMKLETTYILKVRKKRGKEVVSRKMKVQTLDDLDLVVSRTVRAVLDEKQVKQSIKVGEVTEEEQAKTTRKFKVTKQWMFGFGPVYTTNLGEGDTLGIVVGYAWGLDTHFDLVIKGEFSESGGSSQAGIMQLVVGGNYFFTENIHAPYATVDFGFGAAEHENGQDAAGWLFGAGAGWKFFRASTVNFAFEVKYSFMLDEINNKKPGEVAIKALFFF